MIINNIVSALKDAKNIVILPHISMDGDCLGSSLALALALKKLNKEVIIYVEEEIPVIYKFLPGEQIVELFDYEKLISDNVIHDVVVAVDTGDLGRLGTRVEIFKHSRVTINIDHHHTNTEFAFYNYIQSNASATGEVIYQLIKMLGINIDVNMSLCLYVAIATDTGGFRFSNTTSETHKITADLINSGLQVAEISQLIFDNTSLVKLKLMGAAIHSLELFENGKIAVIIITDDMMKEIGAKDEDCDGIVNLGRNIIGVEVAVVIRQKENKEIRINLRSKNYVDVAAIANMYSGGGHKRAAGGTSNKSIDKVKEMILKDIRDVLL